jgi:hypothetical protein
MKEWYGNWCATTPFVTRSTLHLLFGLYLFSWLLDLTPFVINIPYLTIYKLHLWRPFLSPFYTDGLLSVVFLCLALGGMGATLEQVGRKRREGGREGRERRWERVVWLVIFFSTAEGFLTLVCRLLFSPPPPLPPLPRRKAALPFSVSWPRSPS